MPRPERRAFLQARGWTRHSADDWQPSSNSGITASSCTLAMGVRLQLEQELGAPAR
jgi:hypothetical protein